MEFKLFVVILLKIEWWNDNHYGKNIVMINSDFISLIIPGVNSRV